MTVFRTILTRQGFRLQMYQEVPGNPTRSVLKIYEVVRNEYASKLDRNRKVFIISVQVSEGVFIPVCFALLPDKKRSTWDWKEIVGRFPF